VRIGFIENIIANRYILFWFYKYDKGVWKRVRSERTPVGHREVLIERVSRECVLVPLSKNVFKDLNTKNG